MRRTRGSTAQLPQKFTDDGVSGGDADRSSNFFRSDVNANGSINDSDVSLIKSNLGTGLP
jgi:hypothetical protein